jgi:hypothetical protein
MAMLRVRKIKNQQWVAGQRQSHRVIQRSPILDLLKLPFTLSRFEALGTEMLPAQLNVANPAEEAPAFVTWSRGFLRGMKKTTGFTFN